MKSKFLLVIFLLAIGGSMSAQLVLPICSVNLPCPGFPLGSVQAPIDQNGWRNFKVTLTTNVTSFSFVGIPPTPAQASVNVIFTEDATGGRTVTFAAGITNSCTITTTASATTLCQFEYDGVAGQWFSISGGGAGNGAGTVFVASTNCTGANCVTWVDDDATDNCGTATTNWITAINAYNGPGVAQIYIQGSGGGKAFLFKTCGLAFTVNHQVWLQGTLDFQETSPRANCLQEGNTGLTTWNFRATGATASIDWMWHGGTITGCTNATTAGMESMAYVNHAYLDHVTFYNFGPVASGGGLCNVAGVKLDVNAEGHLSGLNVMDTRANYCFSINAQDCGSSGACGPVGGASTLHFSDSSIIDVNAGGSLTSPCGTVGHWEGGSHSTLDNVSIWGFQIPLRLAQTASLTSGAGGWMVHGGTFDSAGCIANSVSAPIQVGHTGTGISQGPATIVGVEFLGGSGHSTNIVALAGDSTDTLHDFSIAGNMVYNTATVGTIPIVLNAAAIASCTNCVSSNNVIGGGSSNTNLTGYDAFVRANAGTLGQGWVGDTQANGAVGINSNAATPAATSANGAAAWYALQSFGGDQFSQATIVAYTSSANDDVAVAVRVVPNLGTFNGYEYLCFNGSRILRRFTGGSATTISTVTAPCIVGDVLRLEIRGTTLTAYHNGAVDLTGTDATYALGQPAITFFENSSLNTDKLNNWTGGSLLPSSAANPSVAPTYLTSSNCQLGGAAGTASPAACVAASAGMIAIPASLITYTVNTTAVTANSEIRVSQVTDNSGLPSSPTCNATATNPIQSARTAGVSFTFTLTSTANVTCYHWEIKN